jgi:hypothetical protein
MPFLACEVSADATNARRNMFVRVWCNMMTSRPEVQTVRRWHGLRTPPSRRDQSAFAFSLIPASSFLMSSGDSFGRSTWIVSL